MDRLLAKSLGRKIRVERLASDVGVSDENPRNPKRRRNAHRRGLSKMYIVSANDATMTRQMIAYFIAAP
jgi:hypothetical protein